MANPITHCLERLNLGDDVKVRQRAEEFQGQLSSMPNKMFDKGPNLKAVICIQLAYESLKNHDWDIKLGAQLAGCTKAAYEAALSKVRQHLNIQPVVTLDMLAVAIGSTTMLKHANILWTEFTAVYLNKLTGAKKINAQKELEQSCWKGAVIYTCAKAYGTHLDKNKLHTLCGCSTAELNKSIKVVKEMCDKSLAKIKNESTTSERTSRKRKEPETVEDEGKKGDPKKDRKGKEKEVQNNSKKKKLPNKPDDINIKAKVKPVSGITSMIMYQDYTKSRVYKDYKKWRTNLIRELSS